jgi:hypothetical protein
VFRHHDRIEGRVAIARYIKRNFTQIGLKGLFAEAVSAIAAVLTRWIVLRITKMFIDLGFKKRFNALLIKPLDKLFKLFLSLNFL